MKKPAGRFTQQSHIAKSGQYSSYRLPWLIFPVCLLLFTYCGGGGGGGGGESGSTPPPNLGSPVTWVGVYESNSTRRYYDGITYFTDAFMILTMQSDNTNIIGNWDGANIQGTLTGSIHENSLSFSMDSTRPNCPGSYSGTGTIIDNNKIIFTYSGSDCGESYSNKPGKLYKLVETGNVGISGNYVAANSYGDFLSIITLITSDNTNYFGETRMLNPIDKSEATADLNGVWGWGEHDPIFNPNLFSWMVMSFSNPQGSLSKGSGYDITGGTLKILEYSEFSFRGCTEADIQGGGSYRCLTYSIVTVP